MTSLIPKKIYICDKELKYIEIYSQNWKRLNPDYEIMLYDNNLCREFLLNEFSETHRDIFDYLQVGPIKADFWRVCVIYKYGGIYVDADAEPIETLGSFIENDVDFVTCSSYGPKFNPNFIMANAGDELLKRCIDTYLQMYEDNIEYSYWVWSIMTIFDKLLELENYNKESGIYYEGNKKYQILKEIQCAEFYDDYNEYKGVMVFKNRYANYDCYTHSFRC